MIPHAFFRCSMTRVYFLAVTIAVSLWVTPPCKASIFPPGSFWSVQTSSNGLTVSKPKVYEERSLRLMLQAAEQRLASLGIIDAASLAKSVGAVQGGRESFSDITFNAMTLPTPQVVTDETNTQSASPSIVDKTTTTQATVTPGVPAATTFPTAFASTAGLQQTFGLSARDLLTEQLALTFQIANLRLALERAVSDRFLDGVTTEGKTFSLPRQVVLLGFQVSVNTPSHYRNAVAEVRVTLESKEESPISLVTMLPTKDTYNVAAITRKSRSVGTGAIVKVFQIGAGFRWGRGTYYLVQDADTLGLEFSESDPKKLTFGWQLRPVLGRKAVDSGLRQVYALITLPDAATFQPNETIRGKIETAWRLWEPKRQTLGPEIAGSVEAQPLILSSAMFTGLEAKLKPKIKRVDWMDLGTDRALVVVEGSNFFPDTQVAIGDSFVDRSNGLQIPDEGRLIFSTSLKALATSRDISVVGRYTGRVPLVFECASCGPATASFKSFQYLSPESVRITLDAANFGANTKPVVVIGEQVFGGRDRPLVILRTGNQISGFVVDAPLALVRTAQRFVVRDLFGGDGLAAEFRPVLTGDFTATKVITLAKRTAGPLLGVSGSGFDGNMIVEVAGKEIPTTVIGAAPANLLTIAPSWDEIRGVDQIVIRRRAATPPPVVLALKPSPEVKKPRLLENTKVVQGFSQPLKFAGSDLESIKEVLFEGKKLVMQIVDDGAALEVRITTEVTGVAGPKALELLLLDGSSVFLPLEVTKPS